ncbi:MAG: nicotinate phosphoribosyltransferase [Nitrososphaerota archaeon]|nr:nicotinate phosphoribosyltransferase [Nitrososphaerota archaeon]
MPWSRRFYIATDEEIRHGLTTDVYFERTRMILEKYGMSNVRVAMEMTCGKLPRGWPWAILCGVEEALRLLEGYPVDVYGLREGTLFVSNDVKGVRVPVMRVEGPYGRFCLLETPLLGLLCQSTGVATMAARVRKKAGDRVILGFGIRRMHPALAPMIDRASYIGGVDGVSSIIGAEAAGVKPTGTMPHALIIVFGDQVEAWKAFDETLPREVPRIALVDTFYDEKVEALMAAEALGDKLVGVRLDTPGSRKGDFAEIIREVRWELNLRGYRNVKIIVSGGIDDESIGELVEAGADGFGVGTSISNAPTVDFAMDIVEVEGKPIAKRGKFSGRKDVWRCPECLAIDVEPVGSSRPSCPSCGISMENILEPLIVGGKIVADLPRPSEIRSYVLRQLSKLRI